MSGVVMVRSFRRKRPIHQGVDLRWPGRIGDLRCRSESDPGMVNSNSTNNLTHCHSSRQYFTPPPDLNSGAVLPVGDGALISNFPVNSCTQIMPKNTIRHLTMAGVESCEASAREDI
ncbi:hypothetical protein E2C01_003328 [Portunus trituberculatus]|uniref:Uncharacterized protein n=1 Tax=Portunus trituberculatus TaxID=210409 RepID=A0A5B7CNK5_PORTR|nr:hypothetical protein [Portunus trituberculatus]